MIQTSTSSLPFKMSLRFGFNVNYTGLLTTTLEGPCCQFFLKSRIPDKAEGRKLCQEKNWNFYVHAPYYINLASEKSSRGFTELALELNEIKDLPGSVVLHVGKRGTLRRVGDNINALINEGFLSSPEKLLLETAAGQGTELGKTWDELRKIFEIVHKSHLLGLCVDTQHVFAAGLTTWENPEEVFETLDQLDMKISLIHLNDSLKPFGSRVDRHSPLCQGYIWKNNPQSLYQLLEIAKDERIDLILETRDRDNDLHVIENK